MAIANKCLKCKANKQHWRYTVCKTCLRQARKSELTPRLNTSEGVKSELLSGDEVHFIYGR